MKRNTRFALAAGGAALLLAFTVPFCPYAASIAFFAPGPAAAGDPASSLGEPSGEGLAAGSTDAVTLGLHGSIALQLASACYDGPGTDLIVCENPFYVAATGSVFVEAMYVEVSTDSVVWARFPTTYTGNVGPFLPTSGAPVTWYRGFAGVLPVSANSTYGIPSLDVVAAGGDAFDLDDLAGEPNVISGAVDVQDIGFVRLVDVQGGVDTDSAGTPVWDCGLNGLASADVDAVIAVNSLCVASNSRPRVELSLVNGFLTIRIEDIDGFTDVKSGLTASVGGLSIPFGSLLPFFVITQLDAFGVTLVTGPVPPGAFPVTLKISARDHQGLFGGDALMLP
jgi:hypothetical protein